MAQIHFLDLEKDLESIEFIKENEPPEGYFLGFSGGKDSVVMYDLTVRSGVQFKAYYSDTGIDPPEVVKFIRDNYPDVIFKRPNYKGHRSFFGMIPIKGFPTKFTRWCCDELKKFPTKKVPLKNRLMGIRAEESAKRAHRTRVDYYKDQIVYKPIFNWLEWEIWEYIMSRELKYCSLYDEGFDRIGCVVCPFICNPNQSQLLRNKNRWPKYYIAFEKAMYKLWVNREKERQLRLGYSSTFEEFLDNWYRGNVVKKGLKF